MKSKSSIIYINFAPYDNAGKILDYLIEHFDLVVHFSFAFHKLSKRNYSNFIHIYKQGRRVTTIPFIPFRTSEGLLFPTLPIRVFLIGIVIFWYILHLKKKYGTFDYYLTVNAYTAWLGSVCKRIGLVKKTIFWIWDYYPPNNSDWRTRIISYPYRSVDKLAAKTSDALFFLSKRLAQLRIRDGVLPSYTDDSIIPIGTDPKRTKKKKPLRIGHFGVLKKNQGLDFLFDNLAALYKSYPTLQIEIIGSGPDEEYFKDRAKKFGSRVKFYGFIENENKLKNIIRNWKAGLALFKPGENTVAFWTDPSKIKYYISHGVPVITTAIVAFTREVDAYKAGIILTYGDKNALEKAIHNIFRNQMTFSRNAYMLAKKYDYKILYPKFFVEAEG